MTRRTGSARAAVLLAGLTAAGQGLGLVRDVVTAATFGAGPDTDAYLVSQGLTTVVLTVLAGAVARAMVPTLSRAVAAGQTARAHDTVRTLLTGTVLVLLVTSGAVTVLAGPLVTLTAPGLDAPARDLAVHLTRLTVAAVVLVAATDLLAGYAQARGRFLLAGAQAVPFNLVMIAAAAVLGPVLGVDGLALGFVVGSAARLLLLLVATRGLGRPARPRLRLRDPDVVEVVRLVPSLLVVTSLTAVNSTVDRAVGSLSGDGAVTALNLAWRTVSLVDSLVVATVVAVLYPLLGAAAGRAGRASLRALVDRALRVLSVVVTPLVVLLAVVPVPAVALLLGRGAFGPDDVAATATAVLPFALGVPALGLSALMGRACLAVGDSRGPAVAAVVAMLVNVVGDLTLGRSLGVTGIAASTSASFVVAAVVLGVRLRAHGAVSLRGTVPALVRTGAAGLLAAAVARLAVAPLGDPPTGASMTALAHVAVAGAVVAVVYTGLLLVLRSSELADLRQVLRRARAGGPA